MKSALKFGALALSLMILAGCNSGGEISAGDMESHYKEREEAAKKLAAEKGESVSMPKQGED